MCNRIVSFSLERKKSKIASLMACITASKAFNESSPRRLRHLMSLVQLQCISWGTSPLSFFTGQMPFLPPNQQHQCTEGMMLWAKKMWLM